MRKKKRQLKICPKCQEATLKNAFNVSGWLAPNMYECTNCGYVGQLFLEVSPEDYKNFKIEKLQEVKICPECGKQSLYFEKNISETTNREMFKCKKCGYIGSLTSKINYEDVMDDKQ
ncbi:MAG: hypothetical protein ACTSR8_09310 [Promethearchaeota archaeon]